MKGRQQKGQAVPPPDAAAATPFFARFLEDQHGVDAEAGVSAPGAHTNAGPSRMTLKYPSDRDEIEDYSSI